MPSHNERPEQKLGTILPSLPCLVHFGAELEEVPAADSFLHTHYYAHARNALRSLTYGTALFKGSFFKWSNLSLAWLDFKALFLKRDKKLLAALRFEMKELFEEAYRICERCTPETEKQLEIFINTLLSNFPFMDPEENEEILLPQKINNAWRQVSYRFTKIDLSPKTGWWSKLLEEEDRIYAYGLEPQDREASPYLLLMGTTYFSGQGAGLSLLGDLTPGQSVGERHNLNELEKWILRHNNIKVTGHSQGGTMAMLVAASYPEQVLQADCLNPAALRQNTLRRLNSSWQGSGAQRPKLRVFTQVGDPVFIFGDGFLPGTELIQVDHAHSAQDSRLVAHAHHYSGHATATYKPLTEDSLAAQSNKRFFFNKLKALADLLTYPLLSAAFTYTLCKRKLMRFCSSLPVKTIFALFIAIAIITCLALMSAGVLTPLALPLVPQLGLLLSHFITEAVLGIASAAAFLGTFYLLPKLTKFAIHLTEFALGCAAACVLGLALTLGGLVCGLATGIRALRKPAAPHYTSSNPQAPELALEIKQNQSPTNKLNIAAQLSINQQPELKRSQSATQVTKPTLQHLAAEEKTKETGAKIPNLRSGLRRSHSDPHFLRSPNTLLKEIKGAGEPDEQQNKPQRFDFRSN